MIGFDLIDLSDPLIQNRTERALKLIRAEEDRVDNHFPTVKDFWKLWTAKEAAYKCLPIMDRYKPTTLPIVISNHHFTVRNESHGIFLFQNNVLLAICALTGRSLPHYWHTFLFNSSDKNTYERVIINYFKKIYGEVALVRNMYRMPMVFVPETNTYIYLSISHHHQYFGFVWQEATASQCHLPS